MRGRRHRERGRKRAAEEGLKQRKKQDRAAATGASTRARSAYPRYSPKIINLNARPGEIIKRVPRLFCLAAKKAVRQERKKERESDEDRRDRSVSNRQKERERKSGSTGEEKQNASPFLNEAKGGSREKDIVRIRRALVAQQGRQTDGRIYAAVLRLVCRLIGATRYW